MLRVKGVQKSYGLLPVLSSVSFSIERGQKIALVGHNGTGKTTLLRIIAGLEEPDSGSVSLNRGTRIGYLPQDTGLVGKEVVVEYLGRVSGITRLEEEISLLSKNQGGQTDTEKLGEIQAEFERLDGYAFDNRMQVVLDGFGLDKSVRKKSLVELSSGQKIKVMLSGILLSGADLLLLDEPTNNLDLPALVWLEDYLKSSRAACIIVSHDRRFLDRIVRKILEINWSSHTARMSSGTYSNYLEGVKKEITRQKSEFEEQKEEIARLKEAVREKKQQSDRGSKWKGSDNDKMLRGFKRDQAGRSARVAKTIEKRIEHMDKLERPAERDPFEIQIEAEKHHGSLHISTSDLVTGYKSGFRIGPIDLSFRFGERVGILGLNGTGKSTLLKTLTGELEPVEGSVTIGSGIRFGNMMQEHESLPRDKSLIDFLMNKSRLDEEHAFNKLVRFGFDRAQVRSRIETLSPGRRARFLLALFSALSVNALILDEPTNHLDIEALDALEETLKSYRGTVIVVSHDRYFLESARLDSIYEIEGSRLKRIGDLSNYVASAERRAERLLKLL